MSNASDGGRAKVIGVIILIVSGIVFLINQGKVSEGERELKEFYGSGRYSKFEYEAFRRDYYLPGEQARDFSLYGMGVGVILIVSGIITSHRKPRRDLLNDETSYPEKTPYLSKAAETVKPKPEDSSNTWRCGECGETNPNSLRTCKGCGRDK